jgi:hypothetical protein
VSAARGVSKTARARHDNLSQLGREINAIGKNK